MYKHLSHYVNFPRLGDGIRSCIKAAPEPEEQEQSSVASRSCNSKNNNHFKKTSKENIKRMSLNISICCLSLLFIFHFVGAKPVSDLQVSSPALLIGTQ